MGDVIDYSMLMEPLELALLWIIEKAMFSHGRPEAEAYPAVLYRR